MVEEAGWVEDLIEEEEFSGTKNLDELRSLAFEDVRYELYDLFLDPFEKNDLYLMRSETRLIRKMKKQFEELKKTKTKKKREVAPSLSEETLQALKAAGYIN